jgi:hypothetical protein
VSEPTIDRLEGDLVTLVRVQDFELLFERFQNPKLYRLTGIKKAPTRKDFEDDVLNDQTLIVWDVVPEGESESIGYAFYVAYDGPPYFQYFPFSGVIDLDIGQDAALLMVHAFFKFTKHPRLHTFIPQPVSDEIDARLIEAGFDRIDEHPTVNLSKEGAYVMERFTYEAYYADEEEEEEKELDFDEPVTGYDEEEE